MPELQLFKRRWHTATDALPIMMAMLCLFHVLWFVPYATGAWSIEGTGLRYDCSHATELRVANYSLFALFGLAAINEAVLTVIGLRGGPFETRKRRAMNPLLYLEVALWLLLLVFTVYATVVVYDPAVSNSCWSNNPCQYNPDVFPLACRDKRGAGIQQLTPSCQALVEVGPQFLNCWDGWIVYGLNWVSSTVDMFNTLGVGTFIKEVKQLAGNATATANITTIQEVMDDPALEPYIEEASYVANCEVYHFISCYLLRINRTDLLESLEQDNLAEPQPCTFWDSLADPEKSCYAESNYWTREQLDGFAPCNITADAAYWNDHLNISVQVDDGSGTYSNGNIIVANSKDVPSYNEFLKSHPDLFQYMNYELLTAVNASTGLDLTSGNSSLTKASDMPWFQCLSQDCQTQSRYADDCTEWGQILALPNPKSRKRFFEILVGTSWGVLGVTALVLFFCFNAFPDYNDVDSWEGSIRTLDRMCLCGGGLTSSATVSGSDMSVSHEIAKSLNLLFGGIDMDPTDRVLGVYLVSERQHRRRQQDVFTALQRAGYIPEPSRSGRIRRLLSGLASGGWRRRQQAANQPAAGEQQSPKLALSDSSDGSPFGCSKDTDGAEAPQAVPLAGAAPAGSAPAQQAKRAEAAPAAARAAGGALPPSPFDAPSGGGGAPQRRPAAGMPQSSSGAPQAKSLMMYQHSMVRLRSGVQGRGVPSSVDAALEAVEEGCAAQDKGCSGLAGGNMELAGGDAAEPEHVLEDPQQVGSGSGSRQQGSGSAGAEGMQQAGGSWQTAAIKVSARYRPLLTPSGCAGMGPPIQPPISPQAAAEIYAGKLDPVDDATLREAQRISRFAVAAYGLQGVMWAQGKRPGMCLANINRLAKCFKKPLGLENKFRKRNFNALLAITGVQPADLLYVSYANVAGGVLPYLIMLHRPSKSVVLSVRGTVSMEDLITDLLSNPVDVADWVPEWVREEAAQRKAAGVAGDESGDSLKAHIGIVSSATAILKDMEDRGLLKEMLISKLMRTATMLGRDAQEVIAEYMATHELPELREQQREGMDRSGKPGVNPLAAAAAGIGLAAGVGKQLFGRRGKSEQEEFKQQEERHLSQLQSLGEEREVHLPLARAQTIIRSKLQLQGWKVVVTGHSLGAAVACMLGMQLRERFSDLQCWAFNPPGGLVSWELSQIAQRYCTSIIVGKDVISRLSFNTSKRVVDEMVVSLARCKRPKLKVLVDVMLGRRKRPQTTPKTFCKFEEIAPEALQLIEGYYRASHLHMQTADTTEMYPPGKLVFMRPFKGKKKQQTVWDAVWIDAATLIAEGILVTPSMMAHHRLFVLGDAFESIFAGEAATEAAALDEQGDEDLMNVAVDLTQL